MNGDSSFFNRESFRELCRSIQDGDESANKSPAEKTLGITQKFVLPLIAIILAFIIALVSYLIYKRSEEGMSALLAEKGASLLNMFESALRTGMRGPAGLQLQTLLKEMSREHGIEFIALTLPEGTIIAHSDQHRLGEMLRVDGAPVNQERMAKLAPDNEEKWFMGQVEGRRVFLVYRTFTMGAKDWDKDLPKPTIFIGLESSPFEITNSQNRSFVAVLSVTIMLAALCGLVALSFAQRAMESRRRQMHAEGKVHMLEEEVRRNEKLAAVGTLAAGVAHEIRNPLSSIKGYATYFSQRFPEGSEDREAAMVMVNEAERLNRVITDLLGLSRPSDVKLRPIPLKNVVNHVLRLLTQYSAAHNIDVRVRMARVIPPVVGDMERLSQALLNLCLNAMEAMPDGGSLHIAISGGKKKICLCIKDTGVGIPPEIMKKIFDPYFTTRGSGTGLGLPMAHKVIKAHNGRIRVASWPSPGPGKSGLTIFKIWLPVADINALEHMDCKNR